MSSTVAVDEQAGTSPETLPATPAGTDGTGYGHPLVRDMYAFASHLQKHPDDVAALETVLGILGGVLSTLSAIGAYQRPAEPHRLGTPEYGIGPKLHDGVSAIRFGSRFLHEARALISESGATASPTAPTLANR